MKQRPQRHRARQVAGTETPLRAEGLSGRDFILLGSRGNNIWGHFWLSRWGEGATVRMDLDSTMLSEISQSRKDECHVISLICGI